MKSKFYLPAIVSSKVITSQSKVGEVILGEKVMDLNEIGNEFLCFIDL